MNVTKLRDTAASLFKVAVSAADPQLSVRRELSENPLPIIREGRILLVALGKAATSMAEEALRHIPKGKPCKAVAITNYENARKVTSFTIRGRRVSYTRNIQPRCCSVRTF